jgi:apolipoprotein N-acyltransferase
VLPDLLALAGGLLLPFAFAPFDLPFLAVAALLLLFAGWLEATPGQALRRGYLFGLGQFGFGVHWVYHSMHDYGGASAAEAVGLTALFAAILSLYPAVAGWVAVRGFPARPALRALAVFPATWVIAEWYRGFGWSGFPWLQLGYSQIDTPFAGLGPVFGVFGVSWVVALLAGLLLLAPRWRGRRRNLTVLAVLGLMALGAGLSRAPWTRPLGEPFRVTLIQGNTPQTLKWQPENQRAIFEHYAGLTRKHWDSRLVVWPETAVPAFYQQIRETWLAGLEAEARSHGTDLLLGIPWYDPAGDRYYNAVAALGQTPGIYLKRHLVPFGEFLPWRPVFGWVLDILEIPLSDFAIGDDRQPPLAAAGHSLAASICYEDVFGQESLMGLPAADLLVNVTNDAWFGDSIAPRQHIQMARFRALETGRWLLRASNSGVTALIDPKGRITGRLPLFVQDSLTGFVTPMQGSTPYILWGDWPVILGAALLLAGLGWRTRQARCRAA